MKVINGFDSARDMLDKLKHDLAILDHEVTCDGLYNFAVTGFHIVDWIEEDPTIPLAAKNEFIDPNNRKRMIPKELSACQDIANHHKHMIINMYNPKVEETVIEYGCGVGRFGKGGFGIGEAQITIKMVDGTVFDSLELAKRVIEI